MVCLNKFGGFMKHELLVSGATGNIGRYLTRRLVEEGFSVKAASRNGTSPVVGASGVVLDLADAATFPFALENVTSAYVFVPVGHEDAVGFMKPFLQELVGREIKIVFLSGLGA